MNNAQWNRSSAALISNQRIANTKAQPHSTTIEFVKKYGNGVETSLIWCTNFDLFLRHFFCLEPLRSQ